MSDTRIEITHRPTKSQLQEAFELRHEVFIREAKRDRAVETDEHDEDAVHFVATRGHEVIGTLRAYRLHPGDIGLKIGRVAVREELRGQGIGRRMMKAACEWAFAEGFPEVYLHAEVKVAGFYETLGFVPVGEEFQEAGTAHIRMNLRAPGP